MTKRRRHAWIVIALAAAGLAITGCKKKDKDAGAGGDPPASGGQAPAKGGGGGDLESVTIETDQVVIEARVPAGWTRADLDASTASWSDPAAAIYPSTITIGVSCGGDCETIADNAASLTDTMIAAQRNAGYDATVQRQAAVAGGGTEFDLEVTKAGTDPMYSHVRFVVAGAAGAQCMAMGVGQGAAAMRDRLKTACAAMTVRAR